MTAQPDIDAARSFLAATARVLDRRRFERLFDGGGPGPVRDAVAAHRNPDGGFGHALEPDGRGPGSQPAAVLLALEVLDEADAWDEDLVSGACEWLARTAPEAGGTTFVLPAIEGWPHAPWWQPVEGLPPSVTITGQIAAVLHRRGVEHPWLERATEWLWGEVEGILADGGAGLAGIPGSYEALGAVSFLAGAPDRERADAVLGRLGEVLFDRGLVELDPGAESELQRPLGLAPEPDSPARALFDAEAVAADLDRLAGAQRPDGGWTVPWAAWNELAGVEWRGSATVDALACLRANGRLEAAGEPALG